MVDILVSLLKQIVFRIYYLFSSSAHFLAALLNQNLNSVTFSVLYLDRILMTLGNDFSGSSAHTRKNHNNLDTVESKWV